MHLSRTRWKSLSFGLAITAPVMRVNSFAASETYAVSEDTAGFQPMPVVLPIERYATSELRLPDPDRTSVALRGMSRLYWFKTPGCSGMPFPGGIPVLLSFDKCG